MIQIEEPSELVAAQAAAKAAERAGRGEASAAVSDESGDLGDLGDLSGGSDTSAADAAVRPGVAGGEPPAYEIPLSCYTIYSSWQGHYTLQQWMDERPELIEMSANSLELCERSADARSTIP